MNHKIFILMFFTIFSVAVLSTTIHIFASQPAVISPRGHQPIKVKVVNDNPSNFTIKVKSLANLGVNEGALTFVLYLSPRLPAQCGDFLHLRLKYDKPEKHIRVFDLSKHKEVLEAIQTYQCIVIRNIPSE